MYLLPLPPCSHRLSFSFSLFPSPFLSSSISGAVSLEFYPSPAPGSSTNRLVIFFLITIIGHTAADRDGTEDDFLVSGCNFHGGIRRYVS